MLKDVLESDTETFETGPYERAVRVRKWVYLFSAATLVLNKEWFADATVFAWLGLSDVPVSMLWHSASFALLYFIVQYALVAVQVGALYPKILTKRFGERLRNRVKELDREANELMAAAEEAEGKHRHEYNKISERIARAQQSQDRNEIALQTRALDDLSEAYDSNGDLRRQRIHQLSEEARDIISQDPSRNRFVALPEALLDMWRLGPPLVFGSAILIGFGRLSFAL